MCPRADGVLYHLRLPATALVGSAFGSRQLHRRAWHRSVGTEDTAIARLWPQRHAAPGALEEIDAGVDGHRLRVTSAAGWAGKLGVEKRNARGLYRRASGSIEGLRFVMHHCDRYRTTVPKYGVKRMGRDRPNPTIGGVARAVGVNVETIRFYQRKGLLPPPDRSARGIHRYGQAEVERLSVSAEVYFGCRRQIAWHRIARVGRDQFGTNRTPFVPGSNRGSDDAAQVESPPRRPSVSDHRIAWPLQTAICPSRDEGTGGVSGRAHDQLCRGRSARTRGLRSHRPPQTNAAKAIAKQMSKSGAWMRTLDAIAPPRYPVRSTAPRTDVRGIT